MKKYILIILIIFLSFYILLNFSNIVKSDTNEKNTLYVGGTGKGNYSSIKEAINIALNGNLIYVYNGSYFENISINKSINLIGENNEHTIIYGQFNILKIKVDYTTITGALLAKAMAGILLLLWELGIYTKMGLIINFSILHLILQNQ